LLHAFQFAGLLALALVRHSHASVGATGGLSLLFVGKLLGHKQASTTQRYAHLAEHPVRVAGEQVSEAIAIALGQKDQSH
jgi:site-specific recombinase XerD